MKNFPHFVMNLSFFFLSFEYVSHPPSDFFVLPRTSSFIQRWERVIYFREKDQSEFLFNTDLFIAMKDTMLQVTRELPTT